MSKFLFIILLTLSSFAKAQQLESLIEKCEEFHLSGQADSLKKYSKLALEFANKNNDALSKTRLQYFGATTLLRTQPDSAIKLLSAFNKEFLSRNDTKFLPYINASFGAYNRRLGNYKEALKYYNQAIESAKQHYTGSENKKLNRILALQYNSLAVINFEMSDYELSNQNALTASKIANQYNFTQIELASTIILANIQMHFKQLDLAEKSFLEAKNLSIKINDRYRLGVALANLGIINFLRVEASQTNSKAYLASKKYFFEALEMAKEQNDFTAISARYSNLANVENVVKNYQSANNFLKEALKYADLSKSKLLTMQVTTSLARNYLALNDTKMAIELANKGLKMSQEMSNEKELPNLYGILQEAYTKEKDFVKALEFQKAQMSAKDSLYTTSTTAKITELQTKYETEKKVKEIEVLTLQNQAKEAEIKQKNYLILAITLGILMLLGSFFFWNRQRNLKEKQQTAEMKQRLLRAQLNPHFLFNCLNSIQRLYIDGKTAQANDFIADFAQLMRDILEKTSRTTIPLYEEMDFIEAYLSLEKRRLGDKFEYEIIMNDEVKNADFSVPSFIVQPLVENALLHGVLPKNQKGKIKISVNQLNDESLSITVKDDGVGFYESMKKAGKHTSKGMELIKTRLGKKGKMLIKEIKNLNNEILGSEVELVLNT
ncbi:histidine kinase [Emticicia oligotrophica]|uniref:histidine kinase n=1 Tax=Emticicia oligotrophica TaxID=312279 RepID=UPI00273AC0BA|nr:histidine kinase [Emticicia oligotrophica]